MTVTTRPPIYPALVADIGGTNARFGLVKADGTWDSVNLKCADYPDLAAAARDFLARIHPDERPRHAAVCVATAVVGDRVSLTNNAWSFSIEETRAALGLQSLRVVNDFTAVALSVPQLRPEERRKIGAGEPVAGTPVGVLGPGTGLGVSGLIPVGHGWVALAAEGGHVTMAPATDRESAVLDRIRRKFDHVSAERVISGQGLVNLYEALAAIEGRDPRPMSAAQITEAALGHGSELCREALEMFCAMLGTVAGNLALTLGARAGIYIAGGIVPKLGTFFDQSNFRERFIAKGRFAGYQDAIPTYVITHPLPAFLGLKSVLDGLTVGGDRA